MTCPLCGMRKARRRCPALDTLICSVCCGTKRRVEIACPSDCGWLRTAESHPPAVGQRQQADDQRRLFALLDELDEGAYVALTVCLQAALAHRASTVPAPLDEDLQGAAAALAATFETAAKGLIYEHRPETLVAERLTRVWRDALERVAAEGAQGVEAEAGTALRRIERAVRDMRRDCPDRPAAFFDFVGRVLRHGPDAEREGTTLAERALVGLTDAEGRGIL